MVCKELTFPNVIQIDDRAFSRCRQLFTISFPKANRLGDYIFSGCNWLSTIMLTVKGPIECIDTKNEPFSRDISTFSDTDGIMLDYHTNMANYYYGIRTIVIHEDKMYGRSILSPRVTDYRHYIGATARRDFKACSCCYIGFGIVVARNLAKRSKANERWCSRVENKDWPHEFCVKK